MAVGDSATVAGYPLVPDSGVDDARVRWGAREINRTRDLLAQLGLLVPRSKDGFRTAAGIYPAGSAVPDNSVGENGDIYFRIV